MLLKAVKEKLGAFVNNFRPRWTKFTRTNSQYIYHVYNFHGEITHNLGESGCEYDLLAIGLYIIFSSGPINVKQ